MASGRAADSPYPAGTISLQQPFFAQLGLDLSHCFAGTLNLSVAPLELSTRRPDHYFENVRWTQFHPPENFRFWRVSVRVGTASATLKNAEVAGWVYQPDPQTKVLHEQPPQVLEVLAPPLGELAIGSVIDLRVDSSRISVKAPRDAT